MKKPLLHITDHALVRYLERVRGVDVDLLCNRVGRKLDLAREHPAASAVIVDGYRYVIRSGTVVTVEWANGKPVRKLR